jgi:hypothetical protein
MVVKMLIDSWFKCRRCGQETLHELHYAGETLHEITCTRCEKTTYAHHRPIRGYLHEMRLRLTSKPRRIYAEISTGPTSFGTLPRRIISKPARVAREFIEVLH